MGRTEEQTTLREYAARLRNELNAEQTRLRLRYEQDGRADRLLRGRARRVDETLQALWSACSLPQECALVAVGGYGRGELFPYSDVDLLVLLVEPPDSRTAALLETWVGLLWDIGVEVGHSVRTIDECLDEAARDITIQTNLLEARLLSGAHPTFDAFQARFRGVLDVEKFFHAKSAEQEQRYNRFQGTPYALEPNCKESPGGLRDLQIIHWIALAADLGASWGDLVQHGLITPGEAHALSATERALAHIRIRLHHLAQRREDRLLFDHQEALAHSYHIPTRGGRRASEVLMQRYYRNAKKVTQLNTLLLQNLGNRITTQPDLSRRPLNEHFETCGNLLAMRESDLFQREPSAILESFLLLQQHPELKGMTAPTLRALWLARTRIDADFRRSPRNRELFLKLLQQQNGIVHEFRRMNQYGILGRYLPAFGRIVGQMQHDLFHVYTVDQHILQVLRNLRRFTMEEHAHEYPLMTQLIAGYERHWLLYIAALFHDIAKGRGGDHSQLGKFDARRFCINHGLSSDDTALVVWLVERHLTMSQIAQKQDLGDPNVIHGFAALVGDERRLTALYLLTHADIRGTSPKVWNGWKAKLLEDLFLVTRKLLRGDVTPLAQGLNQRQEEARRLLRYYGLGPGVEAALWRELDTVYFMRHEAEEIAWHTRMLYHRPNTASAVVKARPNQVETGLQVMVYAQDKRDLFARLCGYFSRRGFSILDAKIHTTLHGYALDSFVLLDPNQSTDYRDLVALIEHELCERLTPNGVLDRPASGRMSRQLRHFPIQPQVSIQPDERGQHYILSIVAADRPGLLFTVAQSLAKHDVNLHTAKIATLGERAEDTFLISGTTLSQSSRIVALEAELLDQLRL